MNRPAFAPGVIERHRRQHGKHLARWLARAAALVLLAACVAAYVAPSSVGAAL